MERPHARGAQVRRLIKDEREAGNPVAALVHALDLEHSRITLALSNWTEEDEGDDDAQTRAATLARPARRSPEGPLEPACLMPQAPCHWWTKPFTAKHQRWMPSFREARTVVSQSRKHSDS